MEQRSYHAMMYFIFFLTLFHQVSSLIGRVRKERRGEEREPTTRDVTYHPKSAELSLIFLKTQENKICNLLCCLLLALVI
jgi:hypothetical protein